MDTQIVELIGKHYLTAELMRAGLEVATPVRDRGIDLIAYADIGERLTSFVACPIQMKAATNRSFALNTKYARVKNPLLVYVWHVEKAHETTCYALLYNEALAIAEKVGWTQTPSWQKGAYSNTSPSKEIVSLLEPYLMTPEKWWEKITGLKR